MPRHLRNKYDRIKVTSIASLSIVRASDDVYEVSVPTADGFPAGHTIAKLERWLIAILLSSPRLDVGQQLGRPPPLVLRRPPSLSTSYTWSVEAEGSTVRGISNNGSATIVLEQKPNGIEWQVKSRDEADADASVLEQGLVFKANPQIHGYPWQVPESTRNRRILHVLKQQPKKRLRNAASPDLGQQLKKWAERSGADDWIRGHQSQLPKHLWAHDNVLTNFQVWITFRLATHQLNLFYEGKDDSQGCPMDAACAETHITSTHITWTCIRAQQFWRRCLEHWLGHEVSPECLAGYKSYFAARTAPPLGERLQRRIAQMETRERGGSPPNLVGTLQRRVCAALANTESSGA